MNAQNRTDGRDRKRSAALRAQQRGVVGPSGGQVLDDLTRKQRLGISACIAGVVFVVSLLTAWLQYRDDFLYRDRQAKTIDLLDHYVAILDYRISQGESLPDRLEDIDLRDGVQNPEIRFPIHVGYAGHKDLIEWNHDYWDRPFIYETDGETYQIRSLGRDGVEGGRGHDADIGNDRPRGHASLATLPDFLFDKPSQGITDTCALAAVFTFLASFLLTRSRPPTKQMWAALLATAVGTSAVTVIVSLLHVPVLSGH